MPSAGFPAFAGFFNPNRSSDIGEIARLCHAACFWPGRRRSGLRRGVARNRMRTEAGKMPESLVFPIRNGHGVFNDRFGFNQSFLLNSPHDEMPFPQGSIPAALSGSQLP